MTPQEMPERIWVSNATRSVSDVGMGKPFVEYVPASSLTALQAEVKEMRELLIACLQGYVPMKCDLRVDITTILSKEA